MDEQEVLVRRARDADRDGVQNLIDAHILVDDTWPPKHARLAGNLPEWLAANSTLGRWIAITKSNELVGHVGVASVPEGPKSVLWCGELDCETNRLAEVGRLLVHPNYRRTGVSGWMTRRCVRDIVNLGYVPVARALESAKSSQRMMTDLGWRIIGNVTGPRSGNTILLLVAPERLVQAAFEMAFEVGKP